MVPQKLSEMSGSLRANLFIHVNIIQLNYTKCASNNSTAVHMLGKG